MMLTTMFAWATNFYGLPSQTQELKIPLSKISEIFRIGNPRYKVAADMLQLLARDIFYNRFEKHANYEYFAWESNSKSRLAPPEDQEWEGTSTVKASAMIATGYHRHKDKAVFGIGIQKPLHQWKDLRDPLVFGIVGVAKAPDWNVKITKLRMPVFNGKEVIGVRYVPITDENILRGLHYAARCAKNVFEGHNSIPYAWIYRETQKKSLDIIAAELGIKLPAPIPANDRTPSGP